MDRFEAPRADIALLLYIAFVIAFMGLFATALFWLTRPTILPNSGFAAHKPPVQAFRFQDVAAMQSVEDMESRAMKVAETENAKQGIDALAAFASVGRRTVADRRSPAQNMKPPPKPPKKKRVVRAPRHERVATDPWQPPWARSHDYSRGRMPYRYHAQARPARPQGMFFFFQ